MVKGILEDVVESAVKGSKSSEIKQMHVYCKILIPVIIKAQILS